MLQLKGGDVRSSNLSHEKQPTSSLLTRSVRRGMFASLGLGRLVFGLVVLVAMLLVAGQLSADYPLPPLDLASYQSGSVFKLAPEPIEPLGCPNERQLRSKTAVVGSLDCMEKCRGKKDFEACLTECLNSALPLVTWLWGDRRTAFFDASYEPELLALVDGWLAEIGDLDALPQRSRAERSLLMLAKSYYAYLADQRDEASATAKAFVAEYYVVGVSECIVEIAAARDDTLADIVLDDILSLGETSAFDGASPLARAGLTCAGARLVRTSDQAVRFRDIVELNPGVEREVRALLAWVRSRDNTR